MATPIHVFPRVYEYQGVRYARPPSRDLNESTSSMQERLKRTKQKLIKFILWTFFLLGVFFIAKNYFYGISIGAEELVFCSLLVVFLLIWGLISICEAIGYYFPDPPIVNEYTGCLSEHQQTEASRRQSSVRFSIPDTIPDTPPSYSLVATLSPKEEHKVLTIIESPPPSYEKASPERETRG